MYQAKMTPGIQPRKSRPMQIKRSAPQPRRIITAAGGNWRESVDVPRMRVEMGRVYEDGDYA